ncbi:hypothetical protein KIN20_034896 [Parelaphostrongylus tenuis]|uniref:Uncharacterized protein n=1 Tax=Parelaphostrongylus tenuis TaxID=148309 RepID=A0AAD5RAQ6_PARTN|nr:hypothetical protein KIN20_034896 [Parelaphostrongylus tenuis]
MILLESHHFSLPCQPVPAFLRRIRDTQNRGELLYLKKLHCARVSEDEDELVSLSCHPQIEIEQNIQHLRRRLDYYYKAYEDILESARPAKNAVLAHQILLADAYLFHARTKPAYGKEQRKLYQRAIDIYRDLFRMARRSLSVTDLSLLTIVERIALILCENRSMVPSLVAEITSLLDEAEKSMSMFL